MTKNHRAISECISEIFCRIIADFFPINVKVCEFEKINTREREEDDDILKLT